MPKNFCDICENTYLTPAELEKCLLKHVQNVKDEEDDDDDSLELFSEEQLTQPNANDESEEPHTDSEADVKSEEPYSESKKEEDVTLENSKEESSLGTDKIKRSEKNVTYLITNIYKIIASEPAQKRPFNMHNIGFWLEL